MTIWQEVINYFQYLSAFLLLAFTVERWLKLKKAETSANIKIGFLWVLGIVPTIITILWTGLVVNDILNDLLKLGDIHPSTIASFMRYAAGKVIIGVVILIITLVCWIVLSRLKKKKNIIQEDSEDFL